MGIFDIYDLLPQSYKALPSNDTVCKYSVYETENLQKCTVSITDCLQNAYVYQLSGMTHTSFTYQKLNMDCFSVLNGFLGYPDSTQKIFLKFLHAQGLFQTS